MKKKDIIRESRHIVAVYSKDHKPAGYHIQSKSKVAEAVNCILKWHWAEKVGEHDGFIFVRPTNTLLHMSFG